LPASGMVFEILYQGKERLMDRLLLERKSILKGELQKSDDVNVIDYFHVHGKAYFEV
jgi:ATP-dependent DNA ligase